MEGSLVLAAPPQNLKKKQTDNQALKIAVSKADAPQTDLHVSFFFFFLSF